MDLAPAPFDPALAWQRARSVALRPEPFGALVYHFGNRKLSFLKSPTLVSVVQTLADHPSASETLVACGVPEAQRGAYLKALGDLARSQMIEVRTPSPPTTRELAAGPCEGTPSPPTTRELAAGPCEGATPGPAADLKGSR